MIKNTIPRKGIGTRKFGGQVFYYAGRTVYHSKARSVALELASKGIKSRVTESRDLGWMIWTDKPVYVELIKLFGSSGYYNPKDSRLTHVDKWWNTLRYRHWKRLGIRNLEYEKLSREEKDRVYEYFSEGKNPILPGVRPKIDEEQLLSKIVSASEHIPANYKPTKKQLKEWEQLEKVFGETKPTQRQREEAWKKGMVI